MTTERKVTLFQHGDSTYVRDIQQVEKMVTEESLNELLNILLELDLWAKRNNVTIVFEGDSK